MTTEPRREHRTADTARLGAGLLDVLRDLSRDLAAVSLPLQLTGVEDSREAVARLRAQLDDHLIPRLARLGSPAIVVVGGSTGAGKSTLVNSLVGEEVSTASVIRPTTLEPVLAHHPADRELLQAGPLAESVRLVAYEGVPRGLALLDAPDLDSVNDANRETSLRLLEAADLWLFVTTGARYGDAVPWDALTRARDRGAAVALVLNRTPDGVLREVRADLLSRLRGQSMQGVPLFIVPDAGPHQGPLPRASVAAISRWLTMLAGPDRARTAITRTLRGSLRVLRPWTVSAIAAVEAQAAEAARLADLVREALPPVEREIEAVIDAGTLGAGAVRAQWLQLGPGTDVTSSARSRLERALRRSGGSSQEEGLAALLDAVRHAVTGVLISGGLRGEHAVRRALQEAGPAGAALAPSITDERRSRDRRARVAATVEEWISSAGVHDGAGPDVRRRAVLALAAATGLEDAAQALRREDAQGPETAGSLRADLRRRAGSALSAEGDDVLAILGSAELGEQAAAGLRLRLVEFKGYA